MVGRIVGRYNIDGSVLDTFDYCLLVFFRTERRVHLEVCIICLAAFIRKRKIMRTCLAGDLYPSCLGIPYHPDAALCADVADMNTPAHGTCQHDLPCSDIIFGSPVHAFHAQFFGYGTLMHDTAVDNIQIFTMRSN